MSKRKSPNHLKKRPVAGRAAIAKHAIAKSPKHGPVALASILQPRQEFRIARSFRANESPRNSQGGEGLTASAPRHPSHLEQEDPVEISEPLQDDGKLSETENMGFDVFSPTANMQAYQAKLLEILSANIHFSLEYAQRLARVGSPVEVLTVNSEFTSRRIAMFLRHSKQIAELVLRRSRFG